MHISCNLLKTLSRERLIENSFLSKKFFFHNISFFKYSYHFSIMSNKRQAAHGKQNAHQNQKGKQAAQAAAPAAAATEQKPEAPKAN